MGWAHAAFLRAPAKGSFLGGRVEGEGSAEHQPLFVDQWGAECGGGLRWGMQVSPTLRVLYSSGLHGFLLGGWQRPGVWLVIPNMEGLTARSLGMEE